MNSKQTNQYLVLGKLFEEDIDYQKVSEFIEQYVAIAQKNGADGNTTILRIKNLSKELNDAILTSCVDLQGKLPSKNYSEITSDRATVKEAAKLFALSPATIRNWINDKDNPLEALNVGQRKTTVSIRDLKDYMKKLGRK